MNNKAIIGKLILVGLAGIGGYVLLKYLGVI